MSSPASVGGDERARLFCALQLPEEALDALVRWQAGFDLGTARAVPRENLHATLAFLGWTPAAAIPGVVAALERAAGAAGRIELRPLRYRETGSVGMLAFEDVNATGGHLARDLAARLQRLGVYEPEERGWLAHVTLVRFRRRPGLRPGLPPGLDAFRVVRAALYRSRLRPGGAQYEVLEDVRLGG